MTEKRPQTGKSLHEYNQEISEKLKREAKKAVRAESIRSKQEKRDRRK